MTTNDDEDFAAKFGILGGFPGDDKLLARIKECEDLYLKAMTLPSLDPLVSLLADLHFEGRVAVALKILLPSPVRAEILEGIYNYCFENDEAADKDDAFVVDREFVLLSVPESSSNVNDDDLPKGMNTSRHHVFTVVPLLLKLTPSCVSLGERYLASASTRFQVPIVKSLLALQVYRNDKVVALYTKQANGILRKKILAFCKKISFRQVVLETLIRKKEIEFEDYGYSCSTTFVYDHVNSLPDLVDSQLAFRNWKMYGNVYVKIIREHLEACKGDLLLCGWTWKKLSAKIVPSDLVETDHAQALLDLVDEFRPCATQAVPSNVLKHLISISESCSPELLQYDQVYRLQVSSELVASLPKDQRLSLLSKAIESRDFAFLSCVQGTLSDSTLAKALPVAKVLHEATSEQLSEFIKDGEVKGDKLLNLMCTEGLNIVLRSGELSPAVKCIQAWAGWHLRSLPSTLPALAWNEWLTSYFGHMHFTSEVIDRLLETIRCQRPLEGSQMTLYSTSLRVLIRIGVDGLTPAVESHTVGFAELNRYYTQVLGGLFGLRKASNPPLALRRLKEYVEDVATMNILPLVELKFDAAEIDSYVTAGKIDSFRSWAERFLCVGSIKMNRLCLDALTRVVTAASANNRHQILPNSGKHFAKVESADGSISLEYFQPALHQQAIDAGVSVLKRLLTNCRDMQREAWPLVDSFGFQGGSSESSYIIFCCTVLAADLRPADLVSKAKKCLKNSTAHGFISLGHALSKAGLLEDVVVDADEEKRDSILSVTGDFRSAEIQAILQKATELRDGNGRALGHVAWIDRALATKRPKVFASAMRFTTGKLKNEAGLYRSEVFRHLEANLSTVVLLTLKHPDDSATSSIIESIQLLLHNDMSRRDSVSFIFKSFPRCIFRSVVAFDPRALLRETRSAWIDCAVKMSWSLAKASGGDDALVAFSLPLDSSMVLPSSQWVAESTFDALFPFTECRQELSCLRNVYDLLSGIQSDMDLASSFGPRQLSEIVCSALDSTWESRLECSTLPSSKTAVSYAATKGQFSRLVSLCKACGPFWEESSLLAESFDFAFGEIADDTRTPLYYVAMASWLLTEIIAIHVVGRPQDTFFFEIARLARACNTIFVYAVTHGLKDIANDWLEPWLRMRLYHGSIKVSALENMRDSRALPFIVRYTDNGSQPPGIFDESVDRSASNTCNTACALVSMTESVVYNRRLRSMVGACRRDVLSGLLCAPVLSQDAMGLNVNNVFRTEETASTVDDVVFESCVPAQLTFFPAQLSKTYTSCCLSRIRNESLGVNEQTLAMERLMECPSTRCEDVLELVKQSSLSGPILEALILRVFSLDSPWYIIANIFSAAELSKRPQSITASLLSHIANHIHIEQVVRTIDLLLEPSRRRAVKVSLHKAIVRMLFDAKTDSAIKLLDKEWKRKLHKEVRYLFLRLTLVSVVTTPDSNWEWSIVKEVAGAKGLEEESCVLLLSACEPLHEIFSFFSQPTGMEIEDLPIPHGSTCCWSGDEGQRRKTDLLRSLEENSSAVGLRRCATLCRLKSTLSAQPKNSNDVSEACTALKRNLLAPPDTDWDNFYSRWTKQNAMLYGTGVHAILTLAQPGYGTGSLNWADIRQRHPAAIDMHAFVLSVVNELLHEDGIKRLRRKQLLVALDGLYDSGQPARFCFKDDDVREKLQMLSDEGSLQNQAMNKCYGYVGR